MLSRDETVACSIVSSLLALLLFSFPDSAAVAQTSATVVRAKPIPADETPGERPYEMVWANRRPTHTALVSFDSLEGWTLECRDGGHGELFCSQRQRVWESPVARLVYRGTSTNSSLILRPPAPIPIPDGQIAAGQIADGPFSLTIWIYGNNWAWSPDPSTPQVTIGLLIRDNAGGIHTLNIARVNWKEWWLVHRIAPKYLLSKAPLRFVGIQVTGCANAENRELYFEDLAFFHESCAPLSFRNRPKRGIDPFPGQDVGANRGWGRLPFPTRKETILPENVAKRFTTRLNEIKVHARFPSPDDPQREIVRDLYSLFQFEYQGPDGRIDYGIIPEKMPSRGVAVRFNRHPVARVMVGAGPVFPKELQDLHVVRAKKEGETLHIVWEGSLDADKVAIELFLRLWQKSLVVDYVCRGGLATELSYGRIERVEKPELILLPYLNYGGHHLHVLMSHGAEPFFASVWMDWYRSNGSVPYAEDRIARSEIRLNGGVRYLPKTDGKRNDLFERVFVTFSPTFEETLPTIPNPPAKRGREAGTRLWQESWGPQDYTREHERSKRLRAYGIEMLTQCNHEITWRDGGESFTFRTRAAPKRGSDEALQRYIADQRSLGWRAGLYTNYCDFAPVNEFWDTDMVMRRLSGDLVAAWPRCYSPRALFAVEMDRRLAPLIRRKFNSNAAYTDVHTAVAPWDRTDYDARVPGAATFAATFYAYGELLLHDQDVYDGHCWSEGNHQWLYAGLCTGNYGLTYSDLRLWEYPYLPHFDLLKMHPLSVDIGVPWTAQFFHGKEGWNTSANIVSSIDQFLAATIAYGHIGWLVEEQHGIRQTCRSYYMLQQLQSRYVMLKPEEIRYGTSTGTISSSEAFLSGQWKASRLHIRYPNSLEIWVNGNGQAPWPVVHGGETHVLPPHGWLAVQPNEFFESSELVNGKRRDFVGSPEYVFLDGRGSFCVEDGIGTSGSLAVRRSEDGKGLSITAVDGVEGIAIAKPMRAYGRKDVRAMIVRVAEAERISARAFGPDGTDLGPAEVSRHASGWRIAPPEGALRYEIRIE